MGEKEKETATDERDLWPRMMPESPTSSEDVVEQWWEIDLKPMEWETDWDLWPPPLSLTSSEALEGQSKICLICWCSPKGSEDRSRIYIVDLNQNQEGEFIYKSPTISITSEGYNFNYKHFCVYQSELFIFDSPPGSYDSDGGRRVLRYELPKRDVSEVRLRRHDLIKGPYLNYPKYGLEAVTAPDGSLVVFSTNLGQAYYGRIQEGNRDFEIYSPVYGKWISLPGISPTWRKSVPLYIEAYSFVKNVMLLQTKVGFFAMDMDDPFRFAKHLVYDVGLPPLPRVASNDYFVALHSHDLYLTRRVAQDVGKGKCLEYPSIRPLKNQGQRINGSIRLLHRNEKFCKFCISEVQFSSVTLRPYLMIYVYRLNLEEYGEEMKKEKDFKILPATELVKTLTFSFDEESADDSFDVRSLFTDY